MLRWSFFIEIFVVVDVSYVFAVVDVVLMFKGLVIDGFRFC